VQDRRSKTQNGDVVTRLPHPTRVNTSVKVKEGLVGSCAPVLVVGLGYYRCGGLGCEPWTEERLDALFVLHFVSGHVLGSG